MSGNEWDAHGVALMVLTMLLWGQFPSAVFWVHSCEHHLLDFKGNNSELWETHQAVLHVESLFEIIALWAKMAERCHMPKFQGSKLCAMPHITTWLALQCTNDM